MNNLELAQIFNQMADLLEMKEVDFRSRAYRKAARVLDSLEKDVAEIYQAGGIKALKEIQGIGQALAKKIEEYIKTGQIKAYQKQKKQSPVDIEALTNIEGLGPRKIKALYQKLGIKNVKGLTKAAKAGKIGKLEGFGPKSEQNILQGIKMAKIDKGRFLLGAILPIVREIISQIKELPEVKKISVAGSVRRMKETVGDVDILVVSSKPKTVMDFFTEMKGVIKIWAKGPTKSSVRLRAGFDCDLRIVKRESFGAALQYFTGSKDHNILTRRIAIKKGLKLNEYGVFSVKGGKNRRIAGQNEKQVYQAIGLPYIEPEMRTNTGEIEAGLANQLPKLIDYDDIKGDCHTHTEWSDSTGTIEELAKIAKQMGYQYLVITDHASPLGILHGLDEKRLLKQMAEIDKINKRVSGIRILKGVEVDITRDGSLTIKDEVLAKLDLVLGAVHSGFKLTKQDMTERLIKAMKNPHLDVIAHPTGRVIQRRESYQLDFPKIFKTAKQTKTALEINAHASRLDLRDSHIRQAVEAGVKMVIGTDVHSRAYFQMMELGIAQARRGWAEKKDILNSQPLKEFLKSF